MALPYASTPSQLQQVKQDLEKAEARLEEKIEAVEEVAEDSIPAAEKGVPDGVATLDGAGKVPASQLPSYVDDVEEYATLSDFPAEGETGKIYVAIDTGFSYRWGGSTYVKISSSLELGETATTAYAGNKGKANADAIAAIQQTLEGGVVHPETDKGLSSNDFTDALKTKLDNIEDYATHTVIDTEFSIQSDNGISNKKVTNKFSDIGTQLTGKVDKVAGQGLSENNFTDAFKNKLMGVENNSTKTVANPELAGTESDLTSLEVSGIKYAVPSGGSGMTNPMTTAGDIIIGGSSGTPTRLAVGANGKVLKSNGTTVSWQDDETGSTVVANPTLAGTEADLTGLEVNGTKYAVPSGGGGGTTVVANPTLVGTEDSLTGLQVGNTKYKVSNVTNSSTGITINSIFHHIPDKCVPEYSGYGNIRYTDDLDLFGSKITIHGSQFCDNSGTFIRALVNSYPTLFRVNYSIGETAEDSAIYPTFIEIPLYQPFTYYDNNDEAVTIDYFLKITLGTDLKVPPEEPNAYSSCYISVLGFETQFNAFMTGKPSSGDAGSWDISDIYFDYGDFDLEFSMSNIPNLFLLIKNEILCINFNGDGKCQTLELTDSLQEALSSTFTYYIGKGQVTLGC